MKKLYRDEYHGKIAGICAGLADMLNADVTVVRLAAVFLCVATGLWPGIVTYLVGWAIIPDRSDEGAGGGEGAA
jgi:phage shock protein C